MRSPSTFRLVLQLSKRDLEEHPAWASYDDPDDLAAMLGWGVDASWLDRELHSFDGFAEGYTHPLYPLLELRSVVNRNDLFVGADFTLANGLVIPGFTIGSHAFGIFIEGTSEIFNFNLPEHGEESAERVRRALCPDVKNVFPLQFVRAIAVPELERSGTIRAFW